MESFCFGGIPAIDDGRASVFDLNGDYQKEQTQKTYARNISRKSLDSSVLGASTREGVVPATIAMVINGWKQSTHLNQLVIDGVSVGAVIIVGWIVESKRLNSQFSLKVADGTGCIPVRWESDYEKEFGRNLFKNIVPGRLIKLTGSVRRSQTKHQSDSVDPLIVDAAHFVINSSFEEYAYLSTAEIAFRSLSVKDHQKAITMENNVVAADKPHVQEPSTFVKDVRSKEDSQDFPHIRNRLQQSILRIVKASNRAKSTISVTLLNVHLNFQDYSEEEISNATHDLVMEGELILSENGDLVVPC